MPPRSVPPVDRARQGWGAEFDRIARGELASSTEARLKELVHWGGFSSFMTPSALAASADAGIEPIGQVIGLSAGTIVTGYQRTTRPGQGRHKLGQPRWREHTGPVTSWTAMRRRALARLRSQAEMLGANAVVGVVVEREFESGEEKIAEEIPTGQLRFTGTAVRVRALRRVTSPMLTLASAQELWAMLRAGVQPAGIAGGFANIETRPSKATVVASVARRRATPNVELEDLTRSVYEARRLAMDRLVADARELKADGVLGVDLQLEGAETDEARIPALTLSVHVFASAVRRTGAAGAGPEPVVALTDGARG
jgi:uncharacterized protein YbjQ (UPF0145 family)